MVVSIAGAILFWGLPFVSIDGLIICPGFNRRGDSFLGATNIGLGAFTGNNMFQSQGRFFFGGYYLFSTLTAC